MDPWRPMTSIGPTQGRRVLILKASKSRRRTARRGRRERGRRRCRVSWDAVAIGHSGVAADAPCWGRIQRSVSLTSHRQRRAEPCGSANHGTGSSGGSGVRRGVGGAGFLPRGESPASRKTRACGRPSGAAWQNCDLRTSCPCSAGGRGWFGSGGMREPFPQTA